MNYTEPDLSHLTPEQAYDVLASVCQILWNRGDSLVPNWDPNKEFTADDQGELLALLERNDIRPLDNLWPDEEGTLRVEKAKDTFRKAALSIIPAASVLICYRGEDSALFVNDFMLFDEEDGAIEDAHSRLDKHRMKQLGQAVETFAKEVVGAFYPDRSNEEGCEGSISFDLRQGLVKVQHSNLVIKLEELPERVF